VLPVKNRITPECLAHHVPRSRPRGDEQRPHDRRQRHHEFRGRQIHDVFPVAVLSREWPDGVEHDVDAPGPLRDAVQIFVDGGVIEGVNDCGVRMAPTCGDLLRYVVHLGLGAAGQKDLRTFGRELLGDGAAD
jgi:hypothetical protein